MAYPLNLTGLVVGYLRVLSPVPTKVKGYWCHNVACLACGQIVVMRNAGVRYVNWNPNAKPRNCGCIGSNLKHGMTKTPEYKAWGGMRERCERPNAHAYHLYGGRGIRVYDDWKGPGGFQRFFAHVGPRPSPGHSLDRFPNNDGNYEPGNVRWATSTQQNQNKRSNRWITINGETLCLEDWAARARMSPTGLSYRLDNGWKPEDAIKPGRAILNARGTRAMNDKTIRTFDALLTTLEAGQFVHDCTEKMSELLLKMSRCDAAQGEAKGELIIRLKMEATDGTVAIDSTVAIKEPKLERVATTMWLTKEADLASKDPEKQLRAVSDEA